MKFKVGERVKVLTPVGGFGLTNQEGTIIREYHSEYLIKFDRNIKGHEGQGGEYIEQRCWYVIQDKYKNNIILLSPQYFGIVEFTKKYYK